MDFQQYYLDLFEIRNATCKKIASGKYGDADADRLFELAKHPRYPAFFVGAGRIFWHDAGQSGGQRVSYATDHRRSGSSYGPAGKMRAHR